VTLTSKSIFEAFLSDKKGDALLHGHSYTAHAVGCEVANEALALMENISLSDDWISAKASWAKPDGSESPMWSLWDPNFITAISNLPNVEETMTLGSVLSIRVRDPTGGEAFWRCMCRCLHLLQDTHRILLKQCYNRSANFESGQWDIPAPGASPFSIHYRTLGDVAYFMTSLNTSPSVIRSVEDRIWQALGKCKVDRPINYRKKYYQLRQYCARSWKRSNTTVM
jgi:dethiobiotin synthetase/adenosylmethionine--8-amino-7-oxononanoate aminotransferase